MNILIVLQHYNYKILKFLGLSKKYQFLLVLVILGLFLLSFRYLFSVIYDEDLDPYSKFNGNWESLDSRPLPEWYENAKVGIFIHWGIYSVPAFGPSAEWFWKNWKTKQDPAILEFLKKTQPPGFAYEEYAKNFTGELFAVNHLADIFKESGAKYVVLTTKHHDGFTLWPSKYSLGWNSAEVGPRRDIVGDFGKAIRARTNLKYGLYYSLYEWFNEQYLQDRINGFSTYSYVNNKVVPEITELFMSYNPDLLWLDGDWEATTKYWYSKFLLKWIYNNSPTKDTVVTNDRWGKDSRGRHGDFFTILGKAPIPDRALKHKFERGISIDPNSWGFRESAKTEELMTSKNLVRSIVITVSQGGNILINVGLNKDGAISSPMLQRLKEMGSWLKTNGEAIYNTRRWNITNENNDVWYTASFETEHVYAIVLEYPKDGKLILRNIDKVRSKTNSSPILLGTNETLKTTSETSTFTVNLPSKANLLKINELGWVIKIKV